MRKCFKYNLNIYEEIKIRCFVNIKFIHKIYSNKLNYVKIMYTYLATFNKTLYLLQVLYFF